MTKKEKDKYYKDKLKELELTKEPLNLYMIRTAGEAYYNIYLNKDDIKDSIINTKNITILHAIESATAINKLKERIAFVKSQKDFINEVLKEKKYFPLSSPSCLDSPLKSKNTELVVELTKTKYITLSGVSRIAAFKICYPNGINLKIRNTDVLDECIKKRLVAVYNSYLYSNRFDFLSKIGVPDLEELKYIKKVTTCKSRDSYLKNGNIMLKYITCK